jgi:hypothetical protein
MCHAWNRTDLEHCLKAHCRRLVVTGNPLSGAHLLLQKERIAIRAYYQCDIDAFQESRLNDDDDIKLDEDDEQQKHRSLDIRGSQDKNTTTNNNNNNPPKTTNPLRGSHASKTTATTTNNKHMIVMENDFDNVCSFLKSFETAIVLFIMDGPDQQIQQLNDMDSPLHKTERLVRHLSNTYTVRECSVGESRKGLRCISANSFSLLALPLLGYINHQSYTDVAIII